MNESIRHRHTLREITRTRALQIPTSVHVRPKPLKTVSSSRSGVGHSVCSASSISFQCFDRKYRPNEQSGGGGGLNLSEEQNVPAFHIDDILRGNSIDVHTATFYVYEIRGIKQNHEQEEPSRQFLRDTLANQINSKKYRRNTAGAPLAKRFVLKHLRKERMDSQMGFEEATVSLENEATLMKGVNHPNIAKLRGVSIGGTEAYYLTGHHDSYFLSWNRWKRPWRGG